MAWYSDEQYEMIKDSREKKSIAASAFKQRTHCGRGGRVKFPSDYMNRKELNAMNGECKSYRMNDPMSWGDFVEWPNEHKITYIKLIRKRFGASDQYLAEMFGVATNLFAMYVKELGLDPMPKCGDIWDSEKFFNWRAGMKECVEEVAEDAKTPDLTKPMTWDEFKSLSDEQKKTYILGIRDQFGAPDNWIAKAFPVSQSAFWKATKDLGLGAGKGHSKGKAKGKWDREGFMRWAHMEPEQATEIVNEQFQAHVENIEVAERDVTNHLDRYMEATAAIENISVKPVVTVEEKITETVDIPVVNNTAPVTEPVAVAYEPIAFDGNPMPVIPKSGSMTFVGNRAEDILTTLKTLLGDVRVSMTVSWDCEF